MPHASELIQAVEYQEIQKLTDQRPDLQIGDTVNVNVKIVEGNRERIQVFQGVVIAMRGHGVNKAFSVRRVAAHGIGVERTFLFYSPRVESIKVLRHAKVRRAKLYFLRDRSGKSARLKERRMTV